MSKINMNSRGQGRIEYSIGGEKRDINYTWFRGEHCNFAPNVDDLRKEDAALTHILAGWLPAEPMIDPATKVVAFGSCFAEHITKYLSARKFSVLTAKDGEHSGSYLVRFGEGLVNTFAIRQQFEWAFENKTPKEELWHGYDAVAFGYDEQVRVATKNVLAQADVFIITLGLSEVWYDAVTGGVFWRAVPRDKYDATRHKFRVTSVAENKENIKAIYRLIRQHRPEASVIFSLSPIPLVATFRPVSCMTANSVSKAILRAALDEASREIGEPDKLFYWPSYEIVMDLFAERWMPDRRHIKRPILDFIMLLFERVWCKGSQPDKTLLQAWIEARSADGTLPARLPHLFAERQSDKLRALTEKLAEKRSTDAALIGDRCRELGLTP